MNLPGVLGSGWNMDGMWIFFFFGKGYNNVLLQWTATELDTVRVCVCVYRCKCGCVCRCVAVCVAYTKYT